MAITNFTYFNHYIVTFLYLAQNFKSDKFTVIIEDNYIQILNKTLRIRVLKHQSQLQPPFLVFLHEGLGSIELWKDFPQLLAEATGYDALIYERQGYGESSPLDLPRPKNYLELEAQIYLPRLLQRFNIHHPILVGHSDGGTIALLYAAQYPCIKVITAAAHVVVEDITLEGIKKAVELYQTNPKFKQKLEQYHGEKADDLFWAWADTWLDKDFRNWNINDCLSKITCPVLLLQGRDDEYATPQHLELIANGIGPNAQAVLLENCGHSPHVQAKEVMVERSLMFLKN